jgi:predicted nucleic acid-binding protein
VKPVLLDTGCIVALLDRSERHHARCVEVVTELTAPLVTCEAVIAESCYVLRRLTGAPAAVLANIQAGVFRVGFRLDASADAVGRLLSRYRSVPMDLADACLVQMADELETGDILTLDVDFDVYRWRRNRKFTNLLE